MGLSCEGPPSSLHLGNTAKHLRWHKGTSLREERGKAGMGKTRKIQRLARYRVLMRGQRVSVGRRVTLQGVALDTSVPGWEPWKASGAPSLAPHLPVRHLGAAQAGHGFLQVLPKIQHILHCPLPLGLRV